MKITLGRRTFLRTSAATVALTALGQNLAAMAEDMPPADDEEALYKLAQAEGGLTWYQTNPLAPMELVAAEFTKKYPEIPVSVTRLAGPAQYARFVQEVAAGQHIADNLLMGDFSLMNALIDDGHMASWRTPTHDRLPAGFTLGNEAFCVQTNEIALIYNQDRLTEEEIELLRADWANVLDPRFTQRFTASTMRCGGCYVPVHMFLSPQYGERYGWNFLEGVGRQKPAVYSDFQVIIDRVVAGERDFSFWSGSGAAYARWDSGQPIRWLFANPTPVWANDWMGVSRYAPHPASARLFANWWASEDGAYALQNIYGASTVLQGFPDQRKMANETWFKPPVDSFAPDWQRWAQNFDSDMTRWIDILTKNA